MVKTVDIKAELAGRPMLRGRSPETPAAETAAAFATLARFRDGGVFAGSFQGDSDWERHRGGDELVHVLDGATKLTILTGDGPRVLEMKAGMLTVVPQGCWHRFHSAEGVTVLTMTPQPTDHARTDEPPNTED